DGRLRHLLPQAREPGRQPDVQRWRTRPGQEGRAADAARPGANAARQGRREVTFGVPPERRPGWGVIPGPALSAFLGPNRLRLRARQPLYIRADTGYTRPPGWTAGLPRERGNDQHRNALLPGPAAPPRLRALRSARAARHG